MHSHTASTSITDFTKRKESKTKQTTMTHTMANGNTKLPSLIAIYDTVDSKLGILAVQRPVLKDNTLFAHTEHSVLLQCIGWWHSVNQPTRSPTARILESVVSTP